MKVYFKIESIEIPVIDKYMPEEFVRMVLKVYPKDLSKESLNKIANLPDKIIGIDIDNIIEI